MKQNKKEQHKIHEKQFCISVSSCSLHFHTKKNNKLQNFICKIANQTILAHVYFYKFGVVHCS